MAYPVDSSDVEARWRELSTDEATLADTLLEDATELLDNKRPALAAAYESGDISLGLIRMVLVRAVKRVLANPDAVRAQSVGADGAVAVTYGLSTSGTRVVDGLYIDDADLADLDLAIGRVAAGGLRRVGSVRLSAYDTPRRDLSILPLP